MVRGLLPRRLDEMSYKLALAVEEAGTPIEAAFWQREEDERWFLILASPAVDALGAQAVEESIATQLRLTGYGKRLFDLDDVRAVGMNDERLLRVRLKESGVRGEGMSFDGDRLILWARRTSPRSLLVVPIQNDEGSDSGFELTIAPASIQALRFSVTGPDPRLAWKGFLEFPALGDWAASGEGSIGEFGKTVVRLKFEGDRLVLSWQRGVGRGYVPRREVMAALTKYAQENANALRKRGEDDGRSSPKRDGSSSGIGRP